MNDQIIEALAKTRYEREEIPHAGPWEKAPKDSRLVAAFLEEARQDLAAITPLLALEVKERLESKEALKAGEDVLREAAAARPAWAGAVIGAVANTVLADTPAPSEPEEGSR